MNLISGEDLKVKIDRGDDFKLVMTLSEWAFQAKHIPGSINVTRPEQTADLLDKSDEIVVYCSNPACTASQMAYHFLTNRGYEDVLRYAGGVQGWEAAGYPLAGEMIDEN